MTILWLLLGVVSFGLGSYFYLYGETTEKRYLEDMKILRTVIKDMNDRLIVLETWAGDAPEISAAMDSEELKDIY